LKPVNLKQRFKIKIIDSAMGAADEVERPSSSLQEQRRLLDDTPMLT
jgi:hypothetical protein